MTIERDTALTGDEQELKAASRQLVKNFGGQDCAAARFNTQQQRISELVNSRTDAFFRIDQVATMEAETVGYPGHPNVTRALARQSGFELVPTPAIAATGRDLLRLFAKQSRGNSDLAQTILSAHDDDHIDYGEAVQIEAAADQVLATILAIRAEARMIQREQRP